jgi:hypothetical protein
MTHPEFLRLIASRRGVVLAAVVALLTVAGCGLDEYESRMASEMARLQRYDEEEKVLGEPLKMPKLPPKEQGKEPESWSVHLRPIRAVPSNPQEQLEGGLLARYSSGSDLPCLFLGVGTGRKEFAKDVLKLFPSSGKATSETVTLQAAGREIVVSRHTYDDAQSSLSVNFVKRGDTELAIIYRVEKGELARHAAAIDMSLGTVAVDAEASRMRREYDKTHQKSRK